MLYLLCYCQITGICIDCAGKLYLNNTVTCILYNVLAALRNATLELLN